MNMESYSYFNDYFELSEFDSPDEVGSGVNMDTQFLDMINDARQYANVPFVITSGYRTKAHNKKVGGSSTSSHLKGLAADISCVNSVERLLIIAGLLDAGFSRIGIAKDFIHVDCDLSKPSCLWLYEL